MSLQVNYEEKTKKLESTFVYVVLNLKWKLSFSNSKMTNSFKKPRLVYSTSSYKKSIDFSEQ